MSSNALSDVLVVTPIIKIWSGEVILKRNEDLSSATASGLPPTSLVSDGAKKIIDPRALTKLASQRRCVQRDLARIGVRSPMGFLVNPSMEAEVIEMLLERKQAFLALRDELVLNYDSLCREWELKNPAFVELIRRNRPFALEIAGKCDFDFAIYTVAPVNSEDGRERFEAVAKATTCALAEDVATNAKAILKESFEGKERVTQRAVNVVRELVVKLKGFTMFDPRIAPTATALETVLNDVPKSGPLETTQILILKAMLKSMSDPSDLLSLGSGRSAIGDDEIEDEEVATSPSPITVATAHTGMVGSSALFL